ncbi:hypothetical protein [Thermocrinis sp.]|jgi:hypothetical protein|uniref:hypothetical protein n=1 Tax=Thermocrinis sp. TaxID=2024383 RepID=UPI003C0FAC56
MGERVIVERVERGQDCYVLYVRVEKGERKVFKVVASVPPREGQSLLVVKEGGLINVLQPI